MNYKTRNDIRTKIAILAIIIILISASYLWLFLFKPRANSNEVGVFLEKIKKQPSRQIEALKDFPVYLPMDYTGENHRNPFQPSIQKQLATVDGKGPDLNRTREALEEFSLDSLRMVGTISQNNRLWAIIQAPNDRVYRVSIGNFIGKNYGEIIGVTSSEVKLSESIPDNTGHWAKRSAELRLSEK